MTRSRATAKQAGAKFERVVADYLREALNDDRVDRRVKSGAKDRGDIGGVRTFRGGRVVLEIKDYGGRFLIGPWLREADLERAHDDAVAGVVVAKRRGTADPGEQVVILTLADLVALLTGERPAEAALAKPLNAVLRPPAGPAAVPGPLAGTDAPTPPKRTRAAQPTTGAK